MLCINHTTILFYMVLHTLTIQFKKNQKLIVYGVIGVSAIGVDLLVFLALFNFFGVVPWLATTLSVATAMVYAFILNARYNFKMTDQIKRRLFGYMLVSLLGLLLSIVAVEGFHMIGVGANLGKILSLPPIVILQYILNSRFTFRTMENKTSKVMMASEAPMTTVSSALGEVHTPTSTPKRVAVIGGGFTGLSAAYELAKAGHQVTVIEAAPQLGGLVAGFTMGGVPLERAYHFIYKTDTAIINLAHELGVGHTLNFYPSSIAVAYDGKLAPFMKPMDLLRFTPLTWYNRIRAGVVTLYLGKTKRWKRFAKVSAWQWLNRWAGEEVTRVIWEPILRGKFFNYYNTIAMSYVWSRLHVRFNSKDKGDVTEKLGYFSGGFTALSDALVAACTKRGVTFLTSTKPDAIISEADGSVTVQIGDTPMRFDACIATTPSHVFEQLIKEHNTVPAPYLDTLRSVDYLGAVVMVFATSTPHTKYFWHNINYPNHPFLVLLSLSSLVGTEILGGQHISYIGAYVPHDHEYFTMSDEALQAKWIAGVQTMIPSFDPATVTDCQIFRFKNAQHIVDVNYERKIVPYASPLPNVYLSNFTQIFPDDRGTNYSILEGQKVARLVSDGLRNETPDAA